MKLNEDALNVKLKEAEEHNEFVLAELNGYKVRANLQYDFNRTIPQ